MYLEGGDMGTSLDELEAISHRPYPTGFYEGEIKKTPNAPASYLRSREYLGEVLAREDGRIRVRLKNKIVEGRLIEALTPGRIVGFTAENLLSEEGEPISEARVPDSVFTLPAPEGVEAGDYLRGTLE